MTKKLLCLVLVLVMAGALFVPGIFAEAENAGTVQMEENAVPLDDFPPEVPASAEATAEPTPEPTAEPVAEPLAADAGSADVGTEPTATPEPAEATPTEEPVEEEATPAPTEEPAEPTAESGATSEPTATAEPAGASEPTGTPEPTATPQVVATPDPAASTAPDEVYAGANDYSKGVWLHVINGGFPNVMYKGVAIANQSSVWVEFSDPVARTLPAEAYGTIAPTRPHGTFDSWYTRSPIEEMAQYTDGSGNVYEVYTTKNTNGIRIDQTTSVPDGIQVLYAAFTDSGDVKDSDKRVTYYFDRNGIDGGMGHYLTSIRKFEPGNGGHTLEAGELLIRYLNWDGERDILMTKDGLKAYWDGKNAKGGFNGYIFKGWASEPTKTEPDVWPGYVVKSGQSIYAVWEKGDEKSQNFDRSDPEGGPVELLQIGGNLNSDKSGSTHASEGASFTLNAFRTPIRAVVGQITWTATVLNTGTLADIAAARGEKLTLTYDPSQYVDEVKGTVTTKDKGVSITGRGMNLIVENLDGKEHTVIVSASVTTQGEDGEINVTVKCNADAKVSFYHNWQETSKTGKATCTEGVKTSYKCSVSGCNETKTEEGTPLGHVFNYSTESDKGQVITRQPTCTETGTKEFHCLRDGCDEVNESMTLTLPALGHDFKVTTIKVDCKHNEVTKTCQRDDCGYQEVELVTANNTSIESLHKYDEQSNTVSDCKHNKVVSVCSICKKTKTEYVAAENPNGPHKFGQWIKVKEPTGLEAGEERRTCSLCSYYETKTIAMLQPGWNSSGSGKTFVLGSGKFATGLTTVSGKKYYFGSSGVMETGWKTINAGGVAVASSNAGSTYYFGGDGAAQTGWQTISGQRYYMGADGVMRTGLQSIDGRTYYFGADGVLRTGGWVDVGGTWYYMDASGAAQTGWVSVGGTWYYMDASGAMATGWVKDGGAWYYMKSSGAMATGWVRDGGVWYYMKSSGAMATGWVLDGGTWYYMKSSGAMATGWVRDGGTWYYMDASGAMATGWINVGGARYYLDGSGAMLTGRQRIGWRWYNFDASGALIG